MHKNGAAAGDGMPLPRQTCAVAGCGFSAAKTRKTDVPFSHPAIVAGGSRDVVLSNRLADKPWAEYLPDHEELRDVRLADVPTGACIKCLLRHGVSHHLQRRRAAHGAVALHPARLCARSNPRRPNTGEVAGDCARHPATISVSVRV